MNPAPETQPTADRSRSTRLFVALGLLSAALGWAYWPALKAMAHKWEVDPQYSHGWLVPLFAGGLLWFRRERLHPETFHASWWGLPLIGLAIALKLTAGYYYFEWLDFVSFIPCVAGVCLTVGGRAAFAWAWPAILFLGFMVPLPYTLESAMREPLRWVGTKASTYLMQTIGLPAYSEGFVVVVGEERIGVEEACSGLNMLVTFFALSTAVAIVSDRRLWERGVIVVSAVPIALIANVFRVAVVGVLHVNGAHELAENIHNRAEFLMMPVALGLLGIELWLLSSLFIVEEIKPVAIGLDAPASNHERQHASAAGKVHVSAQG